MRRPTVPAVLAACAAAVIAWTGAAGAATAAPTSSAAAPTGATVTAPAKPAAKTTTATYSPRLLDRRRQGLRPLRRARPHGRRAPRPSSRTRCPPGYGPADLQSAYKLPSSTAGAGQTVAIVDAQDDPNAESDLATYRSHVRAAGLHHRERLLPQGEPDRRHRRFPAAGRRLGRRDLPRRRHGLGDLPELPHPAGRGDLRQPGQPGHRGERGGRAGREVRLELLRRRRQRAELGLQPPGRGGHREHR